MAEPEKVPQTAALKKNIAVGLATVFLICFAFWAWQHRTSQQQQVQVERIGVLNLQQAEMYHPQYGRLLKLYTQKIELQEAIAAAKSLNLPQSAKAAVPPQAFVGLAEQKSDMQAYAAYRLLQNELVEKKQEWQKKLEPLEAAAIKKINDTYANPIFNCTLQLDNADNLRLSQEQINALNEKADALKHERDAKVMQAKIEYAAALTKKLTAYRDLRLKQINEKLVAQKTQGALAANAAAADFQSQSAEILQQQLTSLQKQKSELKQLYGQLTNKEQEITALQQAIEQDISSQAAKIALKEHLCAVLAVDTQPFDFSLSPEQQLERYLQNQAVVTERAVDVTQQVIAVYRQ